MEFRMAEDATRMRRFLYCSTPYLLFAPWVPVLLAQSATHAGTHWTEGSVNLVESIGYFAGSLIEILSSPYRSGTLLEHGLIIVSLGFATFGFLRDDSARATRLFLLLTLGITLFGIGVYAVDRIAKGFDHG